MGEPGSSSGFPGGSDSKESACNVGGTDSIPESVRSPGEGRGNPLQYCCLGSPVDRGAWWATVHRVAKSQTRLSDLARTQGLVHVYACSLVLHKHKSVRVRVHTAACGGDGRKARMRDPDGLWGWLCLWLWFLAYMPCSVTLQGGAGHGWVGTGWPLTALSFNGRCFNTKNSAVQFWGQQAERSWLPSNQPLTGN